MRAVVPEADTYNTLRRAPGFSEWIEEKADHAIEACGRNVVAIAPGHAGAGNNPPAHVRSGGGVDPNAQLQCGLIRGDRIESHFGSRTGVPLRAGTP